MGEFAVGSLVRARGREWVVTELDGEGGAGGKGTGQLLIVRPLGGTADETTGIYLPIEKVESATFALPDPTRLGDFRSCRLLRDALRFGFRSSAGPFRSLGHVAVEPRPYQLVPLLLALRLDPVRVLIADDVGIGKTIEAAIIARELLDRGEESRLAVLCPPHLAEQWQAELSEKFHIEAELVLPGTAARLERNLPAGHTIFDLYPHVIISTDFIKTEQRRGEFWRTCPNLVIVDEAHTCAHDGGRGARHGRHQLVAGLAKKPERHLILVTATPHSGNEEAFRSLLSLLDPSFANLPEDLSGDVNRKHRERVAAHMVQRRRADIRHFMKSDTPFPEREEKESPYSLSPEYRKLFQKVLHYARESVRNAGDGQHRLRVRWWSALALLRSLASSPAAASSTLRERSRTADTETVQEADEVGRRTVFDLDLEEEASEETDMAPGGREDGDETGTQARRLLDMARETENLRGPQDLKLQEAARIVKELLAKGCHPIVFCRFIPTAEYVTEEFRALAARGMLPRNAKIECITGNLPPVEREQRILDLAVPEPHILVCTDCLSEGINLQQQFSAVVHYDLSWNPTRHEQREGRVDRFGQAAPKVRVVTLFDVDNPIDGIVLDVLLRKHRQIRSSLGISVPVPVSTDEVVEAIFEEVLLRGAPRGQQGEHEQGMIPGIEEHVRPRLEDLYGKWEAAGARERRSRTVFAQQRTAERVEEVVANELAEVRRAIGSSDDVARFMRDTLRAHQALVEDTPRGISVDATAAPVALREAMALRTNRFLARFSPDVLADELYLARTHPTVEGAASHVMDSALDSLADGVARRCGAIRTSAVSTRTTLLLVRLRFHLVVRRPDGEVPLLAEDWQVVAFEGSPESPRWMEPTRAEALLDAIPEGANVLEEMAEERTRQVNDALPGLLPHLEELALERGQVLLQAHNRVREAASNRVRTVRVEPQLPPDVLGIYSYFPAGPLPSRPSGQSAPGGHR